VIYGESLPKLAGPKGLQFALHGGEDYELLFTAAPSAKVPNLIAGVQVTRIGEIVSGEAICIADAQGQIKQLEPAGWQHFG
jgi:thiamine-monophosphate kinase